MEDCSKSYTLDDIKKMVGQCGCSDSKLETSKIVLFGAGQQGSDAYERIGYMYLS